MKDPAAGRAKALTGALLLGSLLAGAATARAQTADDPGFRLASREDSRAEFARAVAPFFRAHCDACHRPGDAEAGLVLAELDPDMGSPGSARWSAVLEQLVAGDMPPRKRPRPAQTEVQAVVRWIRAEARRSGRTLAARPRANGNRVPHEALFDPKTTARFDAPARLRRFTPEIYKEWHRQVSRGGAGPLPFSPDRTFDFADMGAPKVDEPTTLELLNGALGIVNVQTAHTLKDGKLQPGPRAVREFMPLFDPAVEPARERMAAAVRHQFKLALLREPTDAERDAFVGFMEKNVKEAGRAAGIRHALAGVLLQPEAFFRSEMGEGPADARGRVRLSPREIAHALAFGLTDGRPDATLLEDAAQGRLGTAEGVAAVVRRMLDDPALPKPRILRFFHEYFEYPRLTSVFKDQAESGVVYTGVTLIEDADRLVGHVLARDRQVLRELLTTTKSFPNHRTGAGRAKAVAEFEAKNAELKAKDPEGYAKKRRDVIGGLHMFRLYNLEFWPPEIFVPSLKDQKPADLPADQRAGILTQPAWLIAHSTNEDNHAIHRGKWVRERLLGGYVPDVPITVNAQLPNDPHKTLRQRMQVTREAYCWNCHRLMDPLGLAFERYDHFGRFRTEEVKRPRGDRPPLLKAPLDTSGAITDSGDPRLDGEVADAIELVRKLAASERVEQVFVRYAFRYWMGRNETPGDGPSLRAAHQAYRRSDGSLKALIAALLSSDSFLYRVPAPEEKKR